MRFISFTFLVDERKCNKWRDEPETALEGLYLAQLADFTILSSNIVLAKPFSVH